MEDDTLVAEAVAAASRMVAKKSSMPHQNNYQTECDLEQLHKFISMGCCLYRVGSNPEGSHPCAAYVTA